MEAFWRQRCLVHVIRPPVFVSWSLRLLPALRDWQRSPLPFFVIGFQGHGSQVFKKDILVLYWVVLYSNINKLRYADDTTLVAKLKRN